MSNNTPAPIKAVYGAIKNESAQKKFNQYKVGSVVDYEQECLFAKQQLQKNDYILNAAQNNIEALQAAILNVAAIGISLNPATAHAYLVPRAPKQGMPAQICLDISYRGLIKLATDSGSIKWAKAELVYENDDFEWCGPCTEPVHKADPFSTDRGKVKGAYCIAKLPDDSVLVETMSLAEIHKIQNTSKAQSGPWRTWWEEMAKKSVIKRASKTWPQTENESRLARAIEVLNEHEGSAFTIEEQKKFFDLIEKSDQMGLLMFTRHCDEEKMNALFNSFPEGQKTKKKNRVRELLAQAHQMIETAHERIPELIGMQDDDGLLEILDEIDIGYLVLQPEHQHYLEKLISDRVSYE